MGFIIAAALIALPILAVVKNTGSNT